MGAIHFIFEPFVWDVFQCPLGAVRVGLVAQSSSGSPCQLGPAQKSWVGSLGHRQHSWIFGQVLASPGKMGCVQALSPSFVLHWIPFSAFERGGKKSTSSHAWRSQVFSFLSPVADCDPAYSVHTVGQFFLYSNSNSYLLCFLDSSQVRTLQSLRSKPWEPS